MDPYITPSSNPRRVFRTPIIVPASVVLVIAIFAGYAGFFEARTDAGAISYLEKISFEVFLLCEVGMIFLTLYNKSQLERFLKDHQAIEDQNDLEDLKAIARTNMYSALFLLTFLALGSLTAIMAILNLGIVYRVIVALLTIFSAWLLNLYKPLEEQIKQIDCTDENLEVQLNNVLQCWMHKPFPNF